MKPDPETADIARHFADEGILIYDKELTRGFISQMLRNPIYAQADLEMYEFFKSQGTVVINEAADFAGTNGCYLYQGRDVQARKNKHLKDQILVVAPSEGLVSADVWLRCRKKLMASGVRSSLICCLQAVGFRHCGNAHRREILVDIVFC